MNASEKTRWLQEHIPHRLRAALARLEALNLLLGTSTLSDHVLNTDDQKVRRRCETDSIWEGRLAAVRWLIDFVGVTQGSDGSPKRPISRSGDLRISDVGGAQFDLISTDAQLLADVWKGCSQGSSHPTGTYTHPCVNETQLSNVLLIIVAHLQKELYDREGLKIEQVAFVP